MTKDELSNAYFEWMYQLVCNDKYARRSTHRKLLCTLHSIDFDYIMPMDANRAKDGVNLRLRFGYECGYNEQLTEAYLTDECSILEMLIALSLKCEEHIMYDPEVGDRLGQWFWGMIVSLGLGAMNDKDFDRDYTHMVIGRFLNREYEPNGAGGLFTVDNPKRDMRDVEIWSQMCWYLNDMLES